MYNLTTEMIQNPKTHDDPSLVPSNGDSTVNANIKLSGTILKLMHLLLLIVILLFSQLNAECSEKSLKKTAIEINQQSNSIEAKCSDINNWRALKRGMNKIQVRNLLGEAYRVDASSTVETWTYNPSGSVDFSTADLVNGWHEPEEPNSLDKFIDATKQASEEADKRRELYYRNKGMNNHRQ